ncbi:putative LRR receptor-like serine/threonine-protein kinase [Senna tora]|uniref:Putative LRR receptor-like serine/threonine-protein kinase n=1 Tax=Senna tora TaxID=362788 RepID=A0A834XD34_9FABA|nr:putative LRR receptor-like serine/threonine-protein kinase [Senna tora]
MKRFYPLLPILVKILLNIISISFANSLEEGDLNNVKVKCIKSEEEALLQFKHGFHLPPTSNLLSSWDSETDCCNWDGVGCDTTTGHVISLNLRTTNSSNTLILIGGLSSSLLDLPFLTSLDVSGNDLRQTEVPEFFGSMHNLEYLNLSGTNVRGLVPYHLGNLSHLKSLDLSQNSLTVSNLDWLHGLSSLEELDLSEIRLNNSENWLHVINSLPFLVELRFSNCQLPNLPSHLSYVNITSLQILDLSFNHFEGTIPTWLFEIEHLQHLDLSSNRLYGQFPDEFENLEFLVFLDLSYNNLNGSIPSTLGQIQSQNKLSRQSSLKELYLSYNNFGGCVPDFASYFNLRILDLHANNFHCPIPHFPPTIEILDLSRNSFFGPMSHVCDILGVNNSLLYLDLFRNDLSGNIPSCWEKGKSLYFLFIGDNNLSGHIPSSFGYLENLFVLDLSNNNLSGEIPASLQKCTSLRILSLSQNMLSGEIPTWIGDSLRSLAILDLHFNTLEGHIPRGLCQLNLLNMLDLKGNNLSGTIPRCVFTYMTGVSTIPFLPNNFFEKSTSGFDLAFPHFLHYEYSENYMSRGYSWKLLDFSSNSLTGGIPDETTQHAGLQVLNLSRNQLEGPIPFGIGNMTNMKSLDLSKNRLSCTIPTSLGNLSFLSNLNVSYNNLAGKIPLTTHLQSFEASSFLGNHDLCGPPLANSCSASTNKSLEDQGAFLYPLIFSTSWRNAYFSFLDRMSDNIYVIIAVAAAKLRRKYLNH